MSLHGGIFNSLAGKNFEVFFNLWIQSILTFKRQFWPTVVTGILRVGALQVVVATNIAETSVTIDGIRFVVT